MFGFLNCYKPKGMTSHDVVSVLRKVTNIRQIGHTGTLDPFAQGVLPICIGKATRLIEYLQDDKSYLATVQFGKNTDTYDVEGNVCEVFNKKVCESDIKTALKNFEGEILQMPPMYSAIKVGGKKLYEYARKGETVEVKSRKVTISKIEICEFDEGKQIAKILVDCSKGTYIRSIAYDLGKLLGSGAYLLDLCRTRAGKFCVEGAVNLEELSSAKIVEESLINPLEMINLPSFEINYVEYSKILQGQIIDNRFLLNDGDLTILIYNNVVTAVACVENNFIKVKKVFK